MFHSIEGTEKYRDSLTESEIQFRRKILELLFNKKLDFYSYKTYSCAGIYAIFNKQNGKVYIGQTSKCIWEYLYKDRLKELRSGQMHSENLKKEWGAYGEDTFSFYVLEYIPMESANAEELLNNLEAFYINYFSATKDFSGYNVLETYHNNVSFNDITNGLTGKKEEDVYYNMLTYKLETVPIPRKYITDPRLPFEGKYKGFATTIASAVRDYAKNENPFEQYVADYIAEEKRKASAEHYKNRWEGEEDKVYFYFAQQIQKQFNARLI